MVAMQRKITIGVVVVLLAVASFCSAKPRIVVVGSRITIDSGSHHIEGTLDPEATHLVLIKDQGVSINTFAGDAFVTVLPLKLAEELRVRYGDFFKCKEPGAVQAMQNLQRLVLVTANEQTGQALAEALALVRDWRIPVVSFRGSRIQVTKNTSMNTNVTDKTGTLLYYVSHLEILKPDYLR
jgi:hypothetical protein